MGFSDNSVWINKEFKDFYARNPLKTQNAGAGLRCRYYDGINSEIKKECKSFTKWLRTLYCFPALCQIYFYNAIVIGKKGDRYYGCMIIRKNDLPAIYVAASINKNNKITDEIIHDILFLIAFELTYYFQW